MVGDVEGKGFAEWEWNGGVPMLDEVEMLVLLGEAGSGGRSSTTGGDEAPARESACTGPRDTTSKAPPPYVIRSKSEGRPWSRGLPKPSIRLQFLVLVGYY